MKLHLIAFTLATATAAVGYSQFSNEHCGVVLDNDRRTVLDSITPEILKKLGMQRSVSPDSVCSMPIAKLERAVRRVEMPKPDHPGEAAAFRYQALLNENGEFDVDMVNRAVDQIAEMKRTPRFDAGITRESWESLGPGNIGGRIRSFAFDPTDSNRILAGSVAGGLWESTNSGGHWEPVDDFMANLAITSIVYDPSESDVVYASTGEGFFNADSIRGLGVFKSTDNGDTWQSLENTTTNTDFNYVNRLAMSSDGSALYSATNDGLWKSEDDGVTWQEIFEGTNYVFDDETGESAFAFNRVQDFDISPTNDMSLIASTSGAPLYSEDGGETWSVAAPFPFIDEFDNGDTTFKSVRTFRIETAFSKSDPQIVYASVDQNGGEIYRSNDGGKNYTLVNTGTSYLGSQGWYDNALWVDPVNPEHIIVGGIDLWRSQDGGVTFNQISTWWAAPESAHADHHFIMEHPDYDGTDNKHVYFANDGGMYRADDLDAISEDRDAREFAGWTELNNNLGITQFYGMGVAPDGTIIGGTQDNGTLILKPGADGDSWYETFGGDGGYSTADPTDSNYMYGEYVYLRIHRTTNGGQPWPEPGYSEYIHDTEMSEGALFIAPFILDPNNPNRMLAGSNKLWVSDDVKAADPSWSVLKPLVDSNVTNLSIKSIAVAAGNSDIIVVGYYNGFIYKTVNGTAANPDWTRIDVGEMPSRSNYRLAIDPTDHDTIYASFSGYAEDNFWKTEDGGDTWVLATGSGLESIPPAPIRAIAVHPTKTNRIYVGTELGVFTSENKGNTWSVSNDGPANVAIDELIWQDENTLLAATHGRGIFRATVIDSATPDEVSFARIEDVEVNTEVTSSVVTITGLTVKADVSIVNGEYSLNCNADDASFTSEDGQVSNGAYLCVRHTSSEQTNSETVTTLTLAGNDIEFVSKTVIDRTPDAIDLGSATDVERNAEQMSQAVTVTGIDVPVDISVVGGEYSKSCDVNGFTSESSTIAANETFCVRHTSSEEFDSEVTTTVTIGDLTSSFSSTTLPADRMPEPMTLGEVTGAELEAVQVSPTVTVTGINLPVAISVTGGEYAKNCEEGSFTAESGLIEENESFCVRHTSSANFEATTTTVVTVGEATAEFSSTTIPADSTPDPMALGSVTNVPVSTAQTSQTVTVTGINLPVAISVSGGEYSKNCSATGFTTAAGMIEANETFCVRHTSSASESSTVTTTVTVGEGSASFSSTTQNPAPSSGGSMFWLLSLGLLGLRRKSQR